MWTSVESRDKIFPVGLQAGRLSSKQILRLLAVRILGVQIIAQCPGCSSTWLLDGSAADRRIRCEKCHRLFKVPRWEEVPKAIKIIRSAKGTIYVDQDGKTYG